MKKELTAEEMAHEFEIEFQEVTGSKWEIKNGISKLLKKYAEQEKKSALVGMFTGNDLSSLQSEVHKITGDGEVMVLFNRLLGVSTN